MLALAAERVRGLAGAPAASSASPPRPRTSWRTPRAKLLRKGLDLIVANDVTRTDAGFGADTNAVVVVDRAGGRLELSGSKDAVAAGLWDRIAALRSTVSAAVP